uniref:Uncharacterized protein n=1 Tax=Schistocephalus solidus TaxID=70667 RepID=A0A0X3P1M0_SCHSO
MGLALAMTFTPITISPANTAINSTIRTTNNTNPISAANILITTNTKMNHAGPATLITLLTLRLVMQLLLLPLLTILQLLLPLAPLLPMFIEGTKSRPIPLDSQNFLSLAKHSVNKLDSPQFKGL